MAGEAPPRILYDLTPLTGQRFAENRTVVLLSYDVNYLLARFLVIALLPAAILSLPLNPLLTSWTIIVFLVVWGAVVFVLYALDRAAAAAVAAAVQPVKGEQRADHPAAA